MLRDDRQVAVDNVIVALEQSSDAYADASELLKPDAPEMAARFEKLARRRARLAARLSDHLREMGDLPSEPDQDWETLDVLVRHLWAHFAGSEQKEFLTEAVSREEEIAARLSDALETGLSQPVVETLNEVGEEVHRTLGALRGLQTGAAPQ